MERGREATKSTALASDSVHIGSRSSFQCSLVNTDINEFMKYETRYRFSSYSVTGRSLFKNCGVFCTPPTFLPAKNEEYVSHVILNCNN